MRKRKPKSKPDAATPPGMVRLNDWSDGSPGDVVPCLGIIRDCQVTDFGWRGIAPDGLTVNVRPFSPGSRAEIPEHHLVACSRR
jgi:hypothetical protein